VGSARKHAGSAEAVLGHSVTTPAQIADALAEVLNDLAAEEDIEVAARMVFSPGQAQIDIYPADPAESNHAFGPESRMHWWTIRMRTATADGESVQDFLLASRAPTGNGSVRAALLADSTLGGLVDNIIIDENSPSGYRLYSDPGGKVVRYVGQEWKVATLVSADGFS
jgi:hypothetical protein